MTTPSTAPMASTTAQSTSCYEYLDMDGDGAKLLYDTCDLRPLSSPDLWDDCDDENPSKKQRVKYYRDADGDGVGSSNDSTLACEGELPAGYVTTTPDCNDANASMQSWAYRDADGDMAGSLLRDCVKLGAPGYLATSGDCDDSDPGVNSSASERALDDVDSDCNGFDYPVWDRNGGKVPSGEATAVPDSARCHGVGLALVGVEFWRQKTSGGVAVYVANRGTEPSGAQATLTWSDVNGGDPVTWTLPSIGPQQTQRLDPFVTTGDFVVQFRAGEMGATTQPPAFDGGSPESEAGVASSSDAARPEQLPLCPRTVPVAIIEVPSAQ